MAISSGWWEAAKGWWVNSTDVYRVGYGGSQGEWRADRSSQGQVRSRG
jgi:hypothetical protein